MVEDKFQIEVPISIKSGSEGKKVGKEIGEKIAEQIKKISSSLGKTFSGGSGGGLGGLGSSLGISKGLGAIATKLGVIGIAVGAVVALLSKASPMLKGVLDIFGRAFMMFFRPFGDFLAMLLRPMAIMLLKASAKFLQWSRSTVGENIKDALMAGLKGGSVMDMLNEAFDTDIFTKSLVEMFKGIDWSGVGDKLKEGASNLWDWSLDLASKAWGKIKDSWEWTLDIGERSWERIKEVWNWTLDIGEKIWEFLKTAWNWSLDIGSKIWEAISNAWTWDLDLGNKTWEKMKSSWTWDLNLGSMLWSWIKSKLGFGGQSEVTGYAVGTPFVPETGMYKLHRGEQVVSRNNNKSVILKPSYNFNGPINNDIDLESSIRRANMISEMQLKQRGLV